MSIMSVAVEEKHLGKHLSSLPQRQTLPSLTSIFAAASRVPQSGCIFGCSGLFTEGLGVIRRSVWPRVVHSFPVQDTLQPQTLLFVPGEASCVSSIFSSRLVVLSLITELLF